MTDPGVVPEGWLAGTGLKAEGAFTPMSDLCHDCASLPVRDAIVPVCPPEEPAAEEAPAEEEPAEEQPAE